MFESDLDQSEIIHLDFALLVNLLQCLLPIRVMPLLSYDQWWPVIHWAMIEVSGHGVLNVSLGTWDTHSLSGKLMWGESHLHVIVAISVVMTYSRWGSRAAWCPKYTSLWGFILLITINIHSSVFPPQL